MENIQTVDVVPKDNECQVCDAIMLEPMILPDCGHTFCNSCLARVKDNPVNRHCPICKSAIHIYTKFQPNFSLKKLVEKIKARCNGCNIEGELETLAKHKCPDALVNCRNKGCRQKIKRKDASTHEDSECLYRVVSCEKCWQNTTIANRELHLERTCPEEKINCPLYCRKRPKRKELQIHLLACKKRQRECEIEGCHFFGNQQSMEEHNHQQAEKHVALLKEANKKLQDALLNKDKNALKKRSSDVACFTWSIDAFKPRGSEILERGKKDPMTSGEFECDGMRWRMILFIQASKCDIYLQLKSAVCPVRAAIRFIIGMTTPIVINLKPQERIKEGQMYGTELSLRSLEEKAEENSGWLFIEIFIERISLLM